MDEFLKKVHQFELDGHANARILSAIRSANAPKQVSKRKLSPVLSSLAGVIATAAAIFIVIGAYKTIPGHQTSATGPRHTTHTTTKPVPEKTVTDPSDPNAPSTSYYNADAIKQLAHFKVKVPSPLPGYTMSTQLLTTSTEPAQQVRITLSANTNGPLYTVQEVPNSVKFSPLPMDSPDHLKNVSFDGITVTEAWPDRSNVHGYAFNTGGRYYEVRSMVTNYKHAFTAQQDARAWKIIDSLIRGNSYLN